MVVSLGSLAARCLPSHSFSPPQQDRGRKQDEKLMDEDKGREVTHQLVRGKPDLTLGRLN